MATALQQLGRAPFGTLGVQHIFDTVLHRKERMLTTSVMFYHVPALLLVSPTLVHAEQCPRVLSSHLRTHATCRGPCVPCPTYSGHVRAIWQTVGAEVIAGHARQGCPC